MSPLNPVQVSDLLQAAPAGSVVYLIGAGGCGMSGLGHLLLDLGHTLAGSDLTLNEEIAQLRSRGATVHIGHAAEQLRAAHPVLAVYSSAIRANNPELLAAGELKIPIVRRATLLAALLQRQRGICVAGMHGKTTTSALLSFALKQLPGQTSYAIGAFVPQLERHARFTPDSPLFANESGADNGAPVGRLTPSLTPGGGAEGARPVRSSLGEGGRAGEGEVPFFIVEADESDGSLREFQPEHAIVLNVDAEHLDYYANLDAVCREFQSFAGRTRGLLIFCADDSRLADLFAKRSGAISYGFNPLASYRVGPKAEAESDPTRPATPATCFDIWHNGERLGEFTTLLLGEKNMSNCAAAIWALAACTWPHACTTACRAWLRTRSRLSRC